MQVTSGCTIYRLFVWILLEAGLETDDCDTALKLTPDRERTTVLRFQRIEDEPPAEAEVTPGMIVQPIPAARTAVSSSSSRPKMPLSPDFSRTTCAPVRA